MEEQSIFSGAITNGPGEISDCNSMISHHFPPQQDGPVSASKFKGVVSQQNGHWGAQIYAKHQRIWLGTFKSEKEAAMAYDSAAIKLRNDDTHRNYPWTDITIQERKFQSQLTTVAVLAMIKDGSYGAQFTDFLRAQAQESYSLALLRNSRVGTNLRQLFQKELTPSDVSKLNRLVIPKKYAVKYFPPISEEQKGDGGVIDDVELVFVDRVMKSWKFRYCYWKSSQSYVFTRGWNRFTREKGLKAKDRVSFSSYESGDGSSLCIIDVAYADGRIAEGSRDVIGLHDDRGNGIQGMDLGNDQIEKVVVKDEEKKGIMLFGVRIG